MTEKYKTSYGFTWERVKRQSWTSRKIFYTPTPTCYEQKPTAYARQCTCPFSKGSMKLFILNHIKYYVCLKIYVFVQSSGGTSFFLGGGGDERP